LPALPPPRPLFGTPLVGSLLVRGCIANARTCPVALADSLADDADSRDGRAQPSARLRALHPARERVGRGGAGPRRSAATRRDRARGGAPSLRLLHSFRAKSYPLSPGRGNAAREDRDGQPAAARVRGNIGRLAVADRQQPPPRSRLPAPRLCIRCIARRS